MVYTYIRMCVYIFNAQIIIIHIVQFILHTCIYYTYMYYMYMYIQAYLYTYIIYRHTCIIIYKYIHVYLLGTSFQDSSTYLYIYIDVCMYVLYVQARTCMQQGIVFLGVFNHIMTCHGCIHVYIHVLLMHYIRTCTCTVKCSSVLQQWPCGMS